MKLKDLIKGIKDCRVLGDANVQVQDLAYNASSVTPGSCFAALCGAKADGHDFIGEALSRGAVAVLSEKMVDLGGVTNIVAVNSRQAFALMSAAFFGDPSKSISLVGATGTNGKTTITYLLEAILRMAGKNPGVIGTVAYRFSGISEVASNTTPESYDLQRLLSRMHREGVDSCAIEVSSHALVQERVTGCHFDAAIFTNLSQDHLDFHNDMESYFAAKVLLFERLLAESGKPGAFAAINADDPYGMKIAECCPVPCMSFGFGKEADIKGRNLLLDSKGLSLRIESQWGSFDCRSGLRGRFNAQNILAAAGVALRQGIAPEVVAQAIGGVDVVPGRFEPVANNRGILAIVDYAHTPDALERVLAHAREFAGMGVGRVITVFGCGGDRDHGKRPLMGRAAASLSDIAIITNDNPRTEDPMAIIDEIMRGVKGVSHPLRNDRGYEVIPDRREAIARSVDLAREGDVIVVAGKGHEDYQIIGTRRIHFDDREVLREILLKGER